MTTTNNQIGGNYVVLCYEVTGTKRRGNLRGHWYIYRSQHFATREDASGYAINRPDNIRRWLCERTATISDDGVNAVVEYAITDYKGERVGSVEVSWVRGGEPVWTENQKLPFNGYGAGIGYEGSDYDAGVKPCFMR